MKTWVLLRGLTREAGHWGRFPGLLAERFPQARILTLDFPGNGSQHRLRSPTRIAAMTDACIAQLAGVAPPFGVVAMSMGAMVAIDWASRQPESIAACVLINTSMRPFDPFYKRLRPAQWTSAGRLLLPAGAAQRERIVLRMTSHRPEAAAAVLSEWTGLRRRHPVSRLNALRQLLAAARFVAPDCAPRVPLLVLGSQADALVDVRCSIGLARRWHSDLVLHPAAGHDLPLDDPAWLAARIAEWSGSRGGG